MAGVEVAAARAPSDSPAPRGSLLAYFVLAFVFAWPFFIAVTRQTNPALMTLLAMLGAITPSLAAIVVTARASGMDGVRTLVRPVLRTGVALRWYVFAVTYMAGIKLAAAVLVRLTTGAWPRFGGMELLLVIPFALAISTVAQAGEEIGWRGFALPRLARRIGLRWGSVVLGVIWGLWHSPLFFAPLADTYHQSLLLYTLSVTAISVAMAWLFANSGGSLLLVMLMHSAVNNTKDIVPSAGPPASSIFALNATPVGWMTLLLLWLAAAWFLFTMPRSLNSASPEPPAS